MMNLYKVIGSVVIGDAFVATEKVDTTRLWHMRLGHMSERDLQALHRKRVLPGIKYRELNLCKFCIMGRQSRLAFATSVHKTKGLLDIYTRMYGTFASALIGGACYYVIFYK